MPKWNSYILVLLVGACKTIIRSAECVSLYGVKFTYGCTYKVMFNCNNEDLHFSLEPAFNSLRVHIHAMLNPLYSYIVVHSLISV